MVIQTIGADCGAINNNGEENWGGGGSYRLTLSSNEVILCTLQVHSHLFACISSHTSIPTDMISIV